uniref:Uncharacterized protein n=1 Tax=Caenorhabditis japonica TaxID=281687 RepID=A0A8R1HIL3_CAEJA
MSTTGVKRKSIFETIDDLLSPDPSPSSSSGSTSFGSCATTDNMKLTAKNPSDATFVAAILRTVPIFVLIFKHIPAKRSIDVKGVDNVLHEFKSGNDTNNLVGEIQKKWKMKRNHIRNDNLYWNTFEQQ